MVHQPPFVLAGGHEVVRRQQPEQGAEATLQVLPPGGGPPRALPHCAGLRQVPGKNAREISLKMCFLNSLFSFQALKPYYFTLSPSDMKLLNHVRAQHVSKKIFYHFLTFNPGELPVDCVVPGPGAADELLLQRVPAAGAAEAEEDEAPRKDAEGDGAGGRHQGVLVQNSYFPTLLNSFLCYPINFTGASTSSAAPPCDCPSAPATRGPASSS